MARRRIIRTSLLAVTIAATAAPAASARLIDPVVPPAPAAETPRQDLRNPDQQAPVPGGPSQDLRSPDTIDAANGRGTFSAPDVMVVKVPEPAQPVADGGIDWMDAGIGAGALLGLVLVAAGGSLLIVHRRQAGPVGA